MKVKDIMTKNLITAGRSEIIREVVKKMFKYNLRALPVVDGQKLVGLISHEDIVKKIVLEKFSNFNRVIGIMATDTMTVDPDMDIKELIKLMEERKLKRVPVVKGGKLVGLVTQTDIIRYDAKRLK